MRGNASEIAALANESSNSGGVDSTIDSGDAVEAAKQLALTYETVVAVSGKVDYVGSLTSSHFHVQLRLSLPALYHPEISQQALLNWTFDVYGS